MKECKPNSPEFINLLNKAIGQNQYNMGYSMTSLYTDRGDRPPHCFNYH